MSLAVFYKSEIIYGEILDCSKKLTYSFKVCSYLLLSMNHSEKFNILIYIWLFVIVIIFHGVNEANG